MKSVTILESETVDTSSPHYIRITSVLQKLSDAGYYIQRTAARNAASDNAAVCRLLEKAGDSALPITLVGTFPMITGRYPTNDELKQILSVPDGILEPKLCGCCCIEGCNCE